MTELSHFITDNGERYYCVLFEEDGSAEAVGPIKHSTSGCDPVKLRIEATSAREAKEILAKELGPGSWAKNMQMRK